MSDTQTPDPTPEPAFDPREAMRVLDDQTAASARELRFPEGLLYLLWGAVYLLGYLPLALSRGTDPVADIPLGVALGWFFACLAVGVTVSVVVSARHARGLRGTSARQGMFYGWSWWLAFMGIAGLGYRLGQLGVVDGDQTGIIVNGVSMLLVGVLFMGGGAIWNDATQFVIGAVVCVVTTLALFVGLPAYYWIMALLVGGGFLVLGAVIALRQKASR